jgi:hypothetical protein
MMVASKVYLKLSIKTVQQIYKDLLPGLIILKNKYMAKIEMLKEL